MTMSLHFLEWRTVQANDMVSPIKGAIGLLEGNRAYARRVILIF